MTEKLPSASPEILVSISLWGRVFGPYLDSLSHYWWEGKDLTALE